MSENIVNKIYNPRDYLPELITTLLYASTVSAILSLVVTFQQDNNGLTTMLNTFLIIFLIFIDWNNRILIPSHFPTEDKKEKNKAWLKYSKLAFEISSIIFLIVFYRFFIKYSNVSDTNIVNLYFIFALYLFSCGAWNVVLIRIMSGIDFKPLMKSVLKGNVFDIQGLMKYTGKYVEDIKTDRNSYQETLKNSLTNQPNNAIADVNNFQKCMKQTKIRMNSLRVFAQFIGNHILWANFYAGLLFILNSFNVTFNISWSINITPNYSVPIYIIILPLLVACLIAIVRRFDLENKKTQNIFGILFLLILVGLYTFISINYLIYVIMVQQIIIGILIELLTHKKTE